MYVFPNFRTEYEMTPKSGIKHIQPHYYEPEGASVVDLLPVWREGKSVCLYRGQHNSPTSLPVAQLTLWKSNAPPFWPHVAERINIAYRRSLSENFKVLYDLKMRSVKDQG